MRLVSGESGVASKPSFHVARQVPSWGDSWEKRNRNTPAPQRGSECPQVRAQK